MWTPLAVVISSAGRGKNGETILLGVGISTAVIASMALCRFYIPLSAIYISLYE